MLRLVVSMVVVATCFVLPVGSWGTEIVSTPIVRDVLLNLSIDDLKTATPVQLKRQSDGVLAQGVKSLPEALQFEVVIKGGHADIPVSSRFRKKVPSAVRTSSSSTRTRPKFWRRWAASRCRPFALSPCGRCTCTKPTMRGNLRSANPLANGCLSTRCSCPPLHGPSR